MRHALSCLACSAVLLLATHAFSLPAPYTPEELEAGATVIVDAEVVEVVCTGNPVVTGLEAGGTKTVTTYTSTLMVSSQEKGEAMTMITIVGTTTEYSGEAPVGGWTQPALAKGLKGKFYLKPGDGDAYTYVWWNALVEADASAPADLPVCADEPVDPCADGVTNGDETDMDCGGSTCIGCADGKACMVDGDCASGTCTENVCGSGVVPPTSDPYTPNECWEEECGTEYNACKGDVSCVAYSLCIEIGEGGEDCWTKYDEDHPGTTDENGGHAVYKALQECGWSSCNDPTAASCADPGKQGAADKCGQWDDSWPCNCDDACKQFDDCCSDYDDVCNAAPPCQPNCSGAQCGDDGCGGTCGDCAEGQDCTGGQCVTPCQDECADGDKGCDSNTPWLCSKAKTGCFAKLAGEACEGTCEEGSCKSTTEPTEPGTVGAGQICTSGADCQEGLTCTLVGTATDNTCENIGSAPGTVEEDGGCATSGGQGHTGGLLLLMLGLLLVTVRRQRTSV